MDTERGATLLLLVAAGLLTALLLLPFRSAILGAILLAYLLQRPYRVLAPRIGDRPAALSLVVATVVVLVVPFVLLASAAVRGVRALYTVVEADGGGGVPALLRAVFRTDVDVGTSLRTLVENGTVGDLLQALLDAVGGLGQALVHLTVLLFLVYYFLRDGDDLLSWLGAVSPLPRSTQRDLLARADDLMYAVVVGNVAIAVVDGLLVGFGLFVVGFSDVLFWTVMCVFFAFIPHIGTTVVWIPASAYLVVTGNVVPGVGLFVYGAAVVGSVDNVVRPFLGSPEVGLDPPLFVVGVFAGLAFFGVLGVFYGPIALAMTKIVFETLDVTTPSRTTDA